MVNDPSDSLWKDPLITDDLKDRLGIAYKAYIDTMLEYQRTVETLADNLGLERSNTVPNSPSIATIPRSIDFSRSASPVLKRLFPHIHVDHHKQHPGTSSSAP